MDQTRNPLEEVQALHSRLCQVNNLADLRPIFHRLEELARQYPDNLDVQVAVGDCKQSLVARGNDLKGAGAAAVPQRRPAAWKRVLVACAFLVIAAGAVRWFVMRPRAVTRTPEPAPAAQSAPLVEPPQSVRIATDALPGKVKFDDRPAADLQNGKFVLENVSPGFHTVAITTASYDASFLVELTPSKLPSITGTVMSHDVLVVLVSSFANQARVVTSSGPWKLEVNGQPERTAGPAGVDLKHFQAGVNELIISRGADQRKMKEDFGVAPTLTVFLKTAATARL